MRGKDGDGRIVISVDRRCRRGGHTVQEGRGVERNREVTTRKTSQRDGTDKDVRMKGK